MADTPIRIWTLVDGNRNMLFGSNVREDVDKELERRVAEDPRLRRVLTIVEQTMTGRSRHEPDPDRGEPQSVCVLPWLPLDEPVVMGPLVFDHWSQVRELVPEPARSTADQLLGGFTNVHSDKVDPVVCFFADRVPTARLSEPDTDLMRSCTFLIALAGLAENVYMHHVFEPMNAAHARRLFVNFQSAQPQVRLIRRRREGWAQSQWRSGGLRLIQPAAATARPTAAGSPPPMALYRQQFVDRLAECVGADDSVSRSICQSVVPFLRANDMDEYGAVEQDIVWLVAALEQLLAISQPGSVGRRGFEIHKRVTDLFGDEWSTSDQRLCRRWLQDLTRSRNEIHGHKRRSAAWQTWAHALLASELYPLVVKLLLAGAGRYIIDGVDRMHIGAFPSRVALVEGGGPFEEQALGAQWHQIALDTTKRRIDADGDPSA